MAYSRGKAPALVAVTLFVAIIFLFFVWLTSGPYTEAFPRAFNSSRWKTADLDSKTRCSMILDLEHRVGLIGKTRKQLVDILGEPEENRQNPALSYWLLCPSFSDIWVLDIGWRDGRATSATVHDT